MTDDDEIKAGRAISANTGAQLQQILDIVNKLLGLEEADATEDTTEDAAGMDSEMMSLGDTVVNFGGSMKVLSSEGGMVRVGGQLVRFTPVGDYDLTQDRFDASKTDFDFDFPGKSSTYFNHGLNSHMKKRRLSPVTLTRTESGIFMDGLLNERDEYEAGLIELAKQGKLGASSGVPAHLVEREAEGKGSVITSWPLGKDASYTHTPAESRNVIVPLKSLVTAPVAAAAAEPIKSVLPKEVSMTDDELKALLERVTIEAATKAVEEFKKASPATTKAGIPAVVRDPNDRPYKSIGENLQDIRAFQAGKGMTPRMEAVKSEYKAAGMSEFISSDGGFSLQPDFSIALLDKVYNPPGSGSLLADVTRQPVTGNGFRAVVVDETTRVSSRRGGFIGYWGGEGLPITSSKPQFRRVGSDLEKVFAMTYMTDELLSDAPALGSWVMREGANEIRFQVEDKIVNGTGAGVPLGMLNAPATISQAKETGQASASVVTENVTKMWARMPAYLMGGAKWYINQELLPQLVTLSIAVGLGGQVVPVSIYQPPTVAGGFGTLFGRPVQPIEYCSAVGTVGDIILANMGEYFTIDNGGIQAASSIHVNFTTDETALRFTYRVNGFPFWNAPMTPYKGTNTLSPFITLAAR